MNNTILSQVQVHDPDRNPQAKFPPILVGCTGPVRGFCFLDTTYLLDPDSELSQSASEQKYVTWDRQTHHDISTRDGLTHGDIGGYDEVEKPHKDGLDIRLLCWEALQM